MKSHEMQGYQNLAAAMIQDAGVNINQQNKHADNSARFLLEDADLWFDLLDSGPKSKIHTHFTNMAQNYLDGKVVQEKTTIHSHVENKGVYVRFKTGLMPLAEVCEKYKITDATVRARIYRYPWLYGEQLVLSRYKFRMLDKPSYREVA